MVRTFIAALILSAAAPALAQAPPRAPTSPLPAAPPSADFVTMAAQTDEYERQAGQLAASRASDSRVRDFGQTMVRDHTMTSTELMAAARQAGVKPSPTPPPLRGDQQQMLAALQRASGADFDKTYLGQQQQVHREALSLMQVYSASGADAPLRAAAAKTAPLVEHHLMMVNQIRPGGR